MYPASLHGALCRSLFGEQPRTVIDHLSSINERLITIQYHWGEISDEFYVKAYASQTTLDISEANEAETKLEASFRKEKEGRRNAKLPLPMKAWGTLRDEQPD